MGTSMHLGEMAALGTIRRWQRHKGDSESQLHVGGLRVARIARPAGDSQNAYTLIHVYEAIQPAPIEGFVDRINFFTNLPSTSRCSPSKSFLYTDIETRYTDSFIVN